MLLVALSGPSNNLAVIKVVVLSSVCIFLSELEQLIQYRLLRLYLNLWYSRIVADIQARIALLSEQYDRIRQRLEPILNVRFQNSSDLGFVVIYKCNSLLRNMYIRTYLLSVISGTGIQNI